jgi:glycine/D-amino acid oxidase-like deaminating enzyme
MANTSKSAALFRNVFTSPLNRLLASVSILYYKNLQQEDGVDLGLRSTGYLWLSDDHFVKQFSDLKIKLEKAGQSRPMPEVKFELDEMPLDNLVDLFGVNPSASTVTVGEETIIDLPELKQGFFAPDSGTLSPSKLYNHYEEQFKAMGGETLFMTNVERLLSDRSTPEKEDDGNTVTNSDVKFGLEENFRFTGLHTGDGVIKADKICLAAGTWTNAITDPLGIDSHIKPKTRQLFNVIVKPFNLPKGFVNQTERFPVFVMPPDGIFLKPLRLRGNFIVGWADELGRKFEFEAEPEADPAFFDQYLRPVINAYLPWTKDAELKHQWAGQYHYNTIDGNPFIFNTKNLTVVAGASGSGIMKAHAIGQLTAAKVLGNNLPELIPGSQFPLDTLGFEKRLISKERLII